MIAALRRRISKLLPSGAFARGVSVLAGGTLGARALTIVVSPILSRLYSPDDFGILAVYTAFITILVTVASFRYEAAIPLPGDDEDAAALLWLSLAIVVVVSLLCSIIAITSGARISAALNSPQLIPYFWLVPVGIFTGGVYRVYYNWALRKKRYRVMAKTTITQSVGKLLIQVGGAPWGLIALLGGQAFGENAGSTTLIRDKRAEVPRKISSWHQMRAVARRYKRFPLFTSWSSLSSAAGLRLPPLLLAALFTPAAAGLYMMANRVLATPADVLGTAVSNVFYIHAADAHRENRLGSLVSGLHQILANIAMPPIAVLMLAGPELFTIAFGARWREAGEFAQWMGPWLYLSFVVGPLSKLTLVTDRQDAEFTFQLALLAVRVGGIILGARLGGLMMAVAVFALGSAAMHVGYLVWILRTSNNSINEAIRVTLRAVLITVALVSPIILVNLTIGSRIYPFMFAVVLSGIMIGVRYRRLLQRA